MTEIPLRCYHEAARDPAMIERGRVLQEEHPSWGSLAAWFTMLLAER